MGWQAQMLTLISEHIEVLQRGELSEAGLPLLAPVPFSSMAS